MTSKLKLPNIVAQLIDISTDIPNMVAFERVGKLKIVKNNIFSIITKSLETL
ncbi:hypothetical protein PITCH_A970006 [uncultured Desulfobacterium sp.]|uniref:Uncharacterized protein n=1 Tax=uncultured Desulfobacterium sp. TaxID=201089 RepID=A0A445N448_9BACT|nr:hypothetical protein PITCH_A970006 [uncultured Desulfobacterium sp.]